jgi:hypothetical protein
MRALKWCIGLLLLPVAWTAVAGTARLLASLQPDHLGAHPFAAHGLAIGFSLWIVLFFTLPRPMRTYVLGHELTHAFWALLMGARVSRLRVSARGGSVNVSKTNWFITLAPYFFPFYTFLAIICAAALGMFVDLQPYEPLALGVVGLTYAFHVTFTIAMLMQRQPDILEHGRLFSYSMIALLNALGVGCWIVAAGHPSPADYMALLEHEAWRTWETLSNAWSWILATARGRAL